MIPLITDNQGLAAYCQQVRNSNVLALDTEFIRQSTLYPKLGLIQLYDGQTLALVDPLAISDWQPLQQLCAASGVVKLLHSCSEDIEALATIGITHISPLFDTQLAAELLGWGSSVGYARLVEQLTGEVLDKSESRTDWLARPLSDTQLRYAANDVHFLFPLYEKLWQQMTPQQQSLLLLEGEQLIRRREQQLPLAFKYLEIKNSWQLSPRELAVLRELAAWRDDPGRSALSIAVNVSAKQFRGPRFVRDVMEDTDLTAQERNCCLVCCAPGVVESNGGADEGQHAQGHFDVVEGARAFQRITLQLQGGVGARRVAMGDDQPSHMGIEQMCS